MTTLTRTLTATNQKVQFTISYSGMKTNRERKNKRLQSFKKALQENKLFFDEGVSPTFRKFCTVSIF